MLGQNIHDDLIFRYHSLLKLSQECPGLYNIEQQRCDIHAQLKKLFPSQQMELENVLHNMFEPMSYNTLELYINDQQFFMNNLKKYKVKNG